MFQCLCVRVKLFLLFASILENTFVRGLASKQVIYHRFCGSVSQIYHGTVLPSLLLKSTVCHIGSLTDRCMPGTLAPLVHLVESSIWYNPLLACFCRLSALVDSSSGNLGSAILSTLC